MALEMLKAEIAVLLSQLTEDPQDTSELEFQLREKLNEMRASGMPLPQDLVDLEKTLVEQLSRLDDQRSPGDGSQPPKPSS